MTTQNFEGWVQWNRGLCLQRSDIRPQMLDKVSKHTEQDRANARFMPLWMVVYNRPCRLPPLALICT